MRVVIFGASGMLGKELVKAFSDMAVAAPSPEEVDITESHLVRDYLLNARPELVLNAAAYNLVDQAETEEGYGRAMGVNGKAVGHIARSARLIGAPVIHYSTDQVFAREAEAGFAEDDGPGPVQRLSAYARSKLLGEKLLSREGGNFYLIRTSRLFGERSEEPMAKKSFVEVFLGKAREGLFLSAVAGEVSAATYAPDLARATRELWEDRSPWGIYHLVNDGAASWYQLAKAVVAFSGEGAIVRPVSASAFPRAGFRPRFSTLLNTKRPKLRPWQEALKEYLKQSKN